ncbi:MAG: PRC-barrel domain-containing protein [Gaiellaceae bacterium]|jgi:sporulation protein YlmC with PRC-barrel domain
MRLELGQPVRCSDDLFGELADIVIDPTRRRVTHLVVQPHHQHRLARLVPVELAGPGGGGAQPEILLRCTVEEVRRLAPVQEFAYLRLGEFPVDDPDWDVGVQDVLAMPYYDGNVALGGYAGERDPRVGLNYDRVPKGEVEIRRASAVSSADGHHLGHVDGFLVDDNDQITHLVLEHGHLWGRREVTIPIGEVRKVETDTVSLSLSKDEVGALEPVPVQRWKR